MYNYNIQFKVCSFAVHEEMHTDHLPPSYPGNRSRRTLCKGLLTSIIFSLSSLNLQFGHVSTSALNDLDKQDCNEEN